MIFERYILEDNILKDNSHIDAKYGVRCGKTANADTGNSDWLLSERQRKARYLNFSLVFPVQPH